MSTLRFTREHEWIRLDDDIAVVGISDHAQEQLGDVVFVELPAIGTHFKRGDEAAVVESVKAASEVYAPATGEVVAVNEGLADEPSKVNAHAMGDGWFFKMTLDEAAELDDLLDAAAYKEYLASLD
jgi:glycine cleavage system H protein